ncbi:MAG TPA: hypothetical protein VGK27_05230 [Candidatus Deferrimicrobiaceae bacterium]
MDNNFLDEERLKLWGRIESLELELKQKTPELESELKKSVDAAKNILNSLSSSLSDVSGKQDEINTIFDESVAAAANIKELQDKVVSDATNATASIEEVSQTVEKLKLWHDSALDYFEEIQGVYSDNANVLAKLKEFDAQCEKAKALSSNIESLHKNVEAADGEIDEVYYKIFGYDETDDKTKESKHIAGLKDELDDTYKKLKAGFSSHITITSSALEELSLRMSNFEKTKSDDVQVLLNKFVNEFELVRGKIEALLPKALTAGLSHAYSDKKEQEVREGAKHEIVFRWAILGMSVVSLIPVTVSIVSLLQEVPLAEVILRLPRLVLAIVPLYIPVTWIAYSSNRRINLSKRLAEEYSHKEAISKTYEGLSTQIEGLPDGSGTIDLREKLLYAILEVSSENPGKLISDYNKADHPIMDALDKSIKLTNSVEKLSRIPGLAKLASSLSEKANKIMREENRKAEKSLEANEEDA